MNCQEYREAIAAEPQGVFVGASHADECAACAAFRDEMIALDDKIARALAVDVPELSIPELPPIEDDNVVALPFRQRVTTTPWLAMAATVVIAALVGVYYLNQPNYGSLSEEILAHLEHEPQALRVTDVAVSEDRLTRLLARDVETMDRDMGLISYARSCVINGKRVPHLVIQGKRGPVTLLLLPDEPVESALPLDGETIEGVILPVGESGSVAVIGERGEEELRKIQKKLSDSVKWKT